MAILHYKGYEIETPRQAGNPFAQVRYRVTSLDTKISRWITVSNGHGRGFVVDQIKSAIDEEERQCTGTIGSLNTP